MSEIMQLGFGVIFSNILCTASSILFAAVNNLIMSFVEYSMSTFSTPSCNPTSLPGNWSCSKRIGHPDSMARAIVYWTLSAL
ncbi:hypothetical protein ES332_A04G100200v1 [Gossypium tomentosum]|uniref:Uncharacterized protein n=1 Tax=Gossypium tomentosum TaxID=34277 RepID=A0A5D2R048_GOSTO|nr:hypothetical protein ES332_A04G100200v1 [Gossypium tomentosum]